ncbi:MAG: class I SAM-dependent methyltransferase [Candidatus Limnocylindrales bacterium]
MDQEPRLYRELADWWPLLSAPAEYAEEAAVYRELLRASVDGPLETVLELGSGGGNNASHLKRHFRLTLVDRSPGMLAVSRALNPECEHIVGDMRTVRLGRSFDAVFVHDAVCYLTSEADLRAAMATAFAHCRPGGVALFVPDYVRETFREDTDHGGHDGEGRALRYLDWTWDPDPADTTYIVDFAYLLRHPDGSTTVERDRHLEGLFARAEWLRGLEEAGFRATAQRVDLGEAVGADVFIGRHPGRTGSHGRRARSTLRPGGVPMGDKTPKRPPKPKKPKPKP